MSSRTPVVALIAIASLLVIVPLVMLIAYDQVAPDRPLSSALGLVAAPTATPGTPAVAPAPPGTAITPTPATSGTPVAGAPTPPAAAPTAVAGTPVTGTPAAGALTPPAGRFLPDARFAEYWRNYPDTPGSAVVTGLGWATGPARQIPLAYQPFEGWRGADGCQSESSEMIWRSDTTRIYFLVEDPYRPVGSGEGVCKPTWQSFQDTWAEGQPSNPDVPSLSDRRLTPIRGFGKVWRENLFQKTPGLADGYALAREVGFDGWIQEFENGVIIQWPERNRTWILFDRFNYQTPAGGQQAPIFRSFK